MVKRILIVDDEEEICEFLKELLAAEGLEVDAVIAGERAVELCKSQAYDLAIVDLKLQTAASGLDVIKFIRENQPATKVICITGYVDVALKHHAEQFKIDCFAEKPSAIRPDVILPLVKRTLGLSS